MSANRTANRRRSNAAIQARQLFDQTTELKAIPVKIGWPY